MGATLSATFMSLLIVLFLQISISSWAEDFPESPQTLEDIVETPLPTPQKPETERPQKIEKSTLEKSAKYFGFLTYSPLDLVVPNKLGLTAGFSTTSNSWELEYVTGSFGMPFFLESLGGVRDERFSIIGRHFWNKSLNFSYGLTYFKFSGDVGSDIVSRIPGTPPAQVDVLKVDSWGINLGVSSRWTIEGISVGIDWINWSQPISILHQENLFDSYVSNQTDKDRVDKVIKYMSYFPRFTLLKLQIGMTF